MKHLKYVLTIFIYRMLSLTCGQIIFFSSRVSIFCVGVDKGLYLEHSQ